MMVFSMDAKQAVRLDERLVDVTASTLVLSMVSLLVVLLVISRVERLAGSLAQMKVVLLGTDTLPILAMTLHFLDI